LDLEPLQWVGVVALGILIVGWLVVSFSAPSPRRTVIEWFSATAMYVAILSIFVGLLRKAMASDSTVALVAFGFLCALFGGGLLVSIYQTIASTRGRSDSGPSATS